jgi:hypothetical protein
MASVSRPKITQRTRAHEYAADMIRFSISPFHRLKPSPCQPEDEGWESGCKEQTEYSRSYPIDGHVNAAELFANHKLHVRASCGPHVETLAWAGSCSVSRKRHYDFNFAQPAIQNRWEFPCLPSLMKEEQGGRSIAQKTIAWSSQRSLKYFTLPQTSSHLLVCNPLAVQP